MNKSLRAILFTAILAGAPAGQAAIQISLVPNVETWDAQPVGGGIGTGNATAEWGKFSVTGTEADITDIAGLTSAVNLVSHSGGAINIADPTDANVIATTTSYYSNNGLTQNLDIVSQNSNFRVNLSNGGTIDTGTFGAAHFIQSGINGDTTTSYSMIQARARNSSGSSILTVRVEFDLAGYTPAGVSETIPGLQLFYSSDTNGAAGSWLYLGSFDPSVSFSATPSTSNGFQHFSTDVDVSGLNGGSGLAASQNIFFRWADDNGAGSERQYFMDNNSFYIFPEPSAGLLALSALSGLGFIRRRRAQAL